MPLDHSIKKVLIIGAGPTIIGQGCEFDYSGTQACRALREEGCQVILLNSNPATIMTDSDTADAVYIEPFSPEIIRKIIDRERPDSILPTMGGQAALNCVKEISHLGILQDFNVKTIGITLESIEKADNRELFKIETMKKGLEVPLSFSAANWNEALTATQDLNFPIIVRCSFTLGGQGSGIARNIDELQRICDEGFGFSKKLLIEESIEGWKEFELEVIRDRKGTGIVVCGIENIDPMGVHTGDSIVVSPIQTLSDKEYQLMRKKAFQVMDAIGMISGGCNVQFAVEPKTGRMVCIEINPRVSRSSALASKATGYPIATITAKIAIGYHLDELQNRGSSSSLPASFEPAIDYVVTKIPRFNFEKFPQANQELSTHMKSVGESMAFGRTFKESLNKALSSLDTNAGQERLSKTHDELLINLKIPHALRLQRVNNAFHNGISLDDIHRATRYDLWFLAQINELVDEEKSIAARLVETLNFNDLYRWKQMGFSDEKLASLLNCEEELVRKKREELKIHPVYKRIDSCSGEFASEIPCLYSTYEEECESHPTTRKKVIVLGSGPNRIGQGIEFDYCCVQAVRAIREMGYESIMINCNPETVSTDRDITDKLYFEPLTIEHVREVIRIEKPLGTIIQFGGQTSINVGRNLQAEGASLLGTSFNSIDITSNRKKFRELVSQLGMNQPQTSVFDSKVGIKFPIILRPSYVIGGESIHVIRNAIELKKKLCNSNLRTTSPSILEEFLEGAAEVEIDAISDGNTVFICGIIEHIDPAGIHSGDSLSFMSPHGLKANVLSTLKDQTRKIGQSLHIVGLFNVQFAIHKNKIYILEVNARASRTIPLLSKTTGLPFVKIATKCILGQSLKEQGYKGEAEPKLLALKIPVFPFSRLNIKDEQLGPQMKSTGEVLCVGKTFDELLAKAELYRFHQRDLFPFKFCSTLSYLNTSPQVEVYNLNQA